MKTLGLLFLTMVWAAWTQGAGFAVPSNSVNPASGHPGDAMQAASLPEGRHLTSGKAFDNRRNHGRTSGSNHLPSRANLTKANHPKPLPSTGQRSLPGNAVSFYPPGLGKAGGAATGGLIRNETVNNALPVRPPSVTRLTTTSFNNPRHRGPNPAVVGGLPNFHSSNTGAIDGTRVNRKP